LPKPHGAAPALRLDGNEWQLLGFRARDWLVPDGPDRALPLWRSGGLDLGYRAIPEARPPETHDSPVPRAGGGLEPAELLERLGIYYRIGNASRSGLPPQSVDLIVSDVVFEYLSPEELFEILKEFRRIAAPGAVMSHTISLDDQYAAYDSAITQFNFLRFSDWAWRWLNNPIIPLNRLRISDYRRAFSESGFQVVDETSQRGDPAELARTPLAARFRGYSIEDLLVIYTWLVAIPRHS
jgi:hypothetical protein